MATTTDSLAINKHKQMMLMVDAGSEIGTLHIEKKKLLKISNNNKPSVFSVQRTRLTLNMRSMFCGILKLTDSRLCELKVLKILNNFHFFATSINRMPHISKAVGQCNISNNECNHYEAIEWRRSAMPFQKRMRRDQQQRQQQQNW